MAFEWTKIHLLEHKSSLFKLFCSTHNLQEGDYYKEIDYLGWLINMDKEARAEYEKSVDMPSHELRNICRLLKRQLGMEADPSTFSTTYMHSSISINGPVSWTMQVKDYTGNNLLVSSCNPLTDYLREDTIIKYSIDWKCVKIFPHVP